MKYYKDKEGDIWKAEDISQDFLLAQVYIGVNSSSYCGDGPRWHDMYVEDLKSWTTVEITEEEAFLEML